VFASLLVVLSAAAAALVIEKFVDARKRPLPAPHRPGDIPLPMLAAAVTVVLPVGGVAALILTRSKGGLAAGAVSAVLAAAVVLGRRRLARHRRKLVAACGAAVVAGAAAVAALGVHRGGLPSRSMQVRWEYWVGAAGVVAESPLRGVGAGNFGHGYLRHRLPAAAEGTKTAHDVFVDAACNYGLVGGAIYLAILAGVLIAMTRPSSGASAEDEAGTVRRRAGLIALLASAVAMARWTAVGSMDPGLLFIEVALPALVFAAMLLTAVWAGDSLGADGLRGRWARIVLACGLAGFALHNLVTYTLWTPGPATVFWIGAAAVAGAGARGWSPRLPAAGRWALPAVLTAGILAAGVVLVRPVYRRTALVREASFQLLQRRGLDAIRALSDAAKADPLDAFAPADQARLLLAWREGTPSAPLPSAVAPARLAWRRSPTSTHAGLLSRALGEPRRRPQPARARPRHQQRPAGRQRPPT